MKAEVEISFEQILGMINQLDESQRVQLSEELKRSAVGAKLDEVLTIFRGAPISQEEIDEVCEEVREEIYNDQIKKGNH